VDQKVRNSPRAASLAFPCGKCAPERLAHSVAWDLIDDEYVPCCSDTKDLPTVVEQTGRRVRRSTIPEDDGSDRDLTVDARCNRVGDRFANVGMAF